MPEPATQVIDVRDLAAWIVDPGERRLAGALVAITPEWLVAHGADTLAPELTRDPDRHRRAGLTPATERRLPRVI